MISVKNAENIIRELFRHGQSEFVELRNATRKYLAAPVYAKFDVPGFDNSAMDGYAISLEGWNGSSPFAIVGESAAGDHIQIDLKAGEAMRIFTGAMVPAGADAVVMQEKCERDGNSLLILDDQAKPGLNIRSKGSQTRANDLVLNAGAFLNPGSIGFLASIGIGAVEVYKNPSVSVIVTGKEIIKPGSIPLPGEVFECNSYSLGSALSVLGIHPEIKICNDDQKEISDAISHALLNCDLLIITGGISVGDYDFVLPALQQNEVTELFYKVKQKPAKPLFAGRKSKIPVFGLPGNPASVLTSFYVYVLPVIKAMLGSPEPLKKEDKVLNDPYMKKAGMTHFVKGFTFQNKVEILTGQDSYRMDAFAKANCLIEFDENGESFSAGSIVKIIPF